MSQQLNKQRRVVTDGVYIYEPPEKLRADVHAVKATTTFALATGRLISTKDWELSPSQCKLIPSSTIRHVDAGTDSTRDVIPKTKT